MIRPRVRAAADADADAIQKVLAENEMLVRGLDWSAVAPYWLVAEYRGEIIGCVQVLSGRPLGFIHDLAVLPAYHGQGVGIALWRAAEVALLVMGCQGFVAVTGNKTISGQLKRIHAADLGTHTLFCKAVRGPVAP